MKLINLTGQRFNRWTVLEWRGPGKEKLDGLYFCRCDCGSEKCVWGGNLRGGKSKSCGCLKKEVAKDIAQARRKYKTDEEKKAALKRNAINYAKRHPERVEKKVKEQRQKRKREKPELVNAQARESAKRVSDEIRDSYLRRFPGMEFATAQLFELKREQIRVWRATKQIKSLIKDQLK